MWSSGRGAFCIRCISIFSHKTDALLCFFYLWKAQRQRLFLKLLLQVLRCNGFSSKVSGCSGKSRRDLFPTWEGADAGRVGHPLRESGAKPGLVYRLGGHTERKDSLCELGQEKRREMLLLIITWCDVRVGVSGFLQLDPRSVNFFILSKSS